VAQRDLHDVVCVQKAVDETEAPTLQRLAAFVAAEHASATARTLEQPGSPAAASLAAEAAAARAAALTAGPAPALVYSELFALNPRLPRRPPRSLPAAVLDAGGAPPQDTACAVAALADLLTADTQVPLSRPEMISGGEKGKPDLGFAAWSGRFWPSPADHEAGAASSCGYTHSRRGCACIQLSVDGAYCWRHERAHAVLQGPYLARLSGADLGAGAAVADVLQQVLRGWSGLDVADVDAQVRIATTYHSQHVLQGRVL
jgi:hypothetical protein